MKILLLMLAAIILVGCDEASSAAQKWAVAPAGTDNSIYYAWRLNTETGGLEICLYALSWVHKDASGRLYPDSPRCSPAAVAAIPTH